ncbi:MAG: hypothetical protein ABUL60_21185 [Myxococcales bacterium]
MALNFPVLTACFLIAGSVALPVLAQDVPISDEARAHFTTGVNLLQDPDGARYEEAYREFKEAYAESPSWKILGNLGICAMKLERDSEAISAFEKYLSTGGKRIEKDERAQFQRDLTTLQAGVVPVTLASDPPGAVIEDERVPSAGPVVRNVYTVDKTLQIGVRSGRHRFTARLAGRVDQVWELELSPKQPVSHSFSLPELPAATTAAAPATAAPVVARVDTGSQESSGNGLRTGAYVALGVGVVGVAAGTIFGLRAKSGYKDANAITDDNCPASGRCELGATLFDRRAQLGKDADSAKTLSIVGFALGGLGLAGGVTLFVLSNKKEPTATAIQPYLGVGNVGVLGSF